jgi:hypothetical protein
MFTVASAASVRCLAQVEPGSVMEEFKVLGQRSSVSFGGMNWDLPGEYMNDVAWTLRYGTPTKQQLLYAAGVIEAYCQMTMVDSEAKRRRVIRILRAAARTGADHG